MLAYWDKTSSLTEIPLKLCRASPMFFAYVYCQDVDSKIWWSIEVPITFCSHEEIADDDEKEEDNTGIMWSLMRIEILQIPVVIAVLQANWRGIVMPSVMLPRNRRNTRGTLDKSKECLPVVLLWQSIEGFSRVSFLQIIAFVLFSFVLLPSTNGVNNRVMPRRIFLETFSHSSDSFVLFCAVPDGLIYTTVPIQASLLNLRYPTSGETSFGKIRRGCPISGTILPWMEFQLGSYIRCPLRFSCNLVG